LQESGNLKERVFNKILNHYLASTLFKVKNATPSQITEAVILTAPTKTKMGGSPKYTSDKIPSGIRSPPKANHEIVAD
jgi:hypothetical protein